MQNTSSKAKSSKRRTRLDRDRILDAAVKIARRKGTEALMIRDVASELGVSLMSLYYYFRNREDLINAIITRVGEGIVHPDCQENAVDEVEAVFLAFYDGLFHDAWGIHLLAKGHPSSSNVLPLEQRALEALEGMGLDRSEAWHAYLSLEHYLFGEILAVSGLQHQTNEVIKANEESLTAFPVIEAFRRAGNSAQGAPRDFYRHALRRMIRALAVASE